MPTSRAEQPACADREAAPSPRGCWCVAPRRCAPPAGLYSRGIGLTKGWRLNRARAQGVEGAHALEGELSNLDVLCVALHSCSLLLPFSNGSLS